MFSEYFSTPFGDNDMAHCYFQGKVTGCSYNNDDTFLSMLRILVAPRLQEDDSLNLVISLNSFPDLRNDIDAGLQLRDCVYIPDANEIVVQQFSPGIRTKRAEEWAKVIDEHGKDVMDRFSLRSDSSYEKVETVTAFYKDAMPVYCFINKETRSTLILLASLDIRRYHFLQAGIFAYLPWYFPDKDSITDEEIELMKSIQRGDKARFLEIVNNFASRLDMKTKWMERELDGFESKWENNLLISLKNEWTYTMNQVDSLRSSLSSRIYELHSINTRIDALEMKESDSNEILNYFKKSMSVNFEGVSDAKLRFVVKDYLEFFDEDWIEASMERGGSYLYNPAIDREDNKMLLKALFIDRTLRIRMCAAYELEIPSYIKGVRWYQYPADCNSWMPNPHIDIYECLGDYESAIGAFLIDGDYIGALDQCVASCKSINFGESVTARPFMMNLYGISGENVQRTECKKCIELPNGEVVDAMGAIEYLKSQEGVE